MSSRPAPAARRGLSLRLVLVAAVLAIAGTGAFGLWYLFLRPDGPAPVSLDAAAAPATAPVSTTPAATSGTPDTGSLEGVWSVDPSIGSFADFSGSFVGYRVQEELATIGATEAVGRTPDVTGTLTLEATAITAVDITADLTTLRSDDDRRDGQLGRQGIETDRFPTATFTLTEPIVLDALPAEDDMIAATATGELTLHGVTRTVEVAIEARLARGVVTVVGSMPISFPDYDIERPQSMIVLSVANEGTMEFQLHFTRT